jgi:hypothetical protein
VTDAEDPAGGEGGRRPQTLGGVVYLLVLAAVLTGLALAVAGAWRTGVTWIGGALVAAAGVRVVLPERQAGMLRVRRKGPDVLLMLLGGAGLVTMALWIPAQRV